MNKAAIRKNMAMQRNKLSCEEMECRSLSIITRLMELQAYKSASVIFVYVSFRSEVDTLSFINMALRDGKRIAVPVCIPEGKVLLPCEITGLDDLVPGTWGILEPLKEKRRAIDSSDIDLAVVPGLAFDKAFSRLGYGAGYYDRFLPSLRDNAVKIGICYDFQLLEHLPEEPFDIPMDGVITDSRLLLKEGLS